MTIETASIPTYLSQKLQRQAEGLNRVCDRFARDLDMETLFKIRDAANLIQQSADLQARKAAAVIYRGRN